MIELGDNVTHPEIIPHMEAAEVRCGSPKETVGLTDRGRLYRDIISLLEDVKVARGPLCVTSILNKCPGVRRFIDEYQGDTIEQLQTDVYRTEPELYNFYMKRRAVREKERKKEGL